MRLILVDNYSDLVMADTADMRGPPLEFGDDWRENAILAVRILSEHETTANDRQYVADSRDPRDTSSGYHVFHADISGSEAVPVIDSCDTPGITDLVRRECEYYAFVHCFDAGEEPMPL